MGWCWPLQMLKCSVKQIIVGLQGGLRVAWRKTVTFFEIGSENGQMSK
jgi:hypothetical protein